MVRRAPLDDYVVETLMPDLISHDHAPSAFIVYVKLWHDAGGADGRVQASLSTLAVETGLSKSTVQSALRHLRRRGLIASTSDGATAIPSHRVKAPWRA